MSNCCGNGKGKDKGCCRGKQENCDPPALPAPSVPAPKEEEPKK